MIEIEELDKVDEDFVDYLTPISARAYAKFGLEALAFINDSYKRWSISVDGDTVAIAGLHKKSFIGRPELWLLIFTSFKVPSGVKAIKLAAEKLKHFHPDAFMRVDSSYITGIRFAEYLGLEADHQEGNYIIYRNM